MDKIKLSNKVVHDNKLIASFSKMDKTPLKIFEIALSCIDVNNPPEDNTVYLDKQQLFKCFRAEGNDKYTRFKDHVITLQKQNLYIEIEKRRQNIMPIPFVEWSIEDDINSIKIKFSEEIMPYLIDLKRNFTQYQLRETLSLNSKHSIILFKWLMMNYNQKEYNFNRRKPVITVNELKNITNTKEEYIRFDNFEKRVIYDPLQEINSKTSIYVTYQKIKKGKKIDKIQFFIEDNKERAVYDTKELYQSYSIEDIYESYGKDEDYVLTQQDKTTIDLFVKLYGLKRVLLAVRKCHIEDNFHEDTKIIDIQAVEYYINNNKMEV